MRISNTTCKTVKWQPLYLFCARIKEKRKHENPTHAWNSHVFVTHLNRKWNEYFCLGLLLPCFRFPWPLHTHTLKVWLFLNGDARYSCRCVVRIICLLLSVRRLEIGRIKCRQIWKWKNLSHIIIMTWILAANFGIHHIVHCLTTTNWLFNHCRMIMIDKKKKQEYYYERELSTSNHLTREQVVQKCCVIRIQMKLYRDTRIKVKKTKNVEFIVTLPKVLFVAAL